MEKTAIIKVPDERALLLPPLVKSALSANDQVKYCFALLQTACRHADAPEGGKVPSLSTERRLAGIDDESFDAIVDGSRRSETGDYAIPLALQLLERVRSEIRTMLVPLAIAGDGESAALTSLTSRIADPSGVK
jgi:hypothetical protein